MRPEFGCRIHDHVFGPANAGTAGQIAYDVRRGAGALGAADRGPRGQRQLRQHRRGRPLRRRRLRHPRHERPAEPGVPVLRHSRPRGPGGGRDSRGHGRRLTMLPAPNLDDRTFQEPRGRGQTAGPATMPRMDGPQRVRPRGDPHRGVRPDGRPADLPPQPGPRPQLRQVPRADRRRAPVSGGGTGRRDVLALGAAATAGADQGRDGGRDAAHGYRRTGRLHDNEGPRDHPLLVLAGGRRAAGR